MNEKTRDDRRLEVVWILTETVEESTSINIIRVTRRDREGGEQIALKKQRVYLRGVYAWGVNSTVTKHSDHFVWKNTSEYETRRLDKASSIH